MDLSTILGALTDGGATEEISKTTGASSSQVTDLLSSALPALLGAMQNNSTDTTKAEGLSKALDDHAEADTSDITSFLKNVDKEDGEKIINHVLGDDKEKVTTELAAKSGLDVSQVISTLSSYAPLLLTLLGQQKKSSSTSGGLDVASLLGGLLGGNSNNSDLASTLMSGLSGLLKK